ncbi:MAG: hypothetical protein K0R38_2897 [Polyangiaceae bacterium]|jgi:hypothetical protein|nr:hypothetical protein [Polyangiaceae bacterium]
MKNFRQLGLILSVGTLAAFSITGCGDDVTPPTTTGGTSSGGTAAGGSGTSGGGAGGTSAGGSSAGGTAGKGGGGAGGGGAGGATGGGGAGGATGGGGAGGATGGGGAGGGGAGGGGAGGGGAGGGGGAPSAACNKLCEGTDSIGTVCMSEQNVGASYKDAAMCKTRCGKEQDSAKVGCWQMHVDLAKGASGAQKTEHCGHAIGVGNCTTWPQ